MKSVARGFLGQGAVIRGAVSAAGCGLARDWWEFLAARFVGGLAIGGASVVSPMYIAEISPPHLRGRLVTVSQLNLRTCGTGARESFLGRA